MENLSNSDSIVRLEFTLTFDDYLRLLRLVTRRQLRWFRLIAVLIFVFFLLLPVLPFEGNPSAIERYKQWLGILILPGFIFVIVPAAVYFKAKKQWRAAAILREPRIYEFSDTAVSLSGSSYQGSTQWNNFRRSENVGPHILLWSTQPAAHIIPIHALGDPEKAEAFKSLLRLKVPDCSRLR